MTKKRIKNITYDDYDEDDFDGDDFDDDFDIRVAPATLRPPHPVDLPRIKSSPGPMKRGGARRGQTAPPLPPLTSEPEAMPPASSVGETSLPSSSPERGSPIAVPATPAASAAEDSPLRLSESPDPGAELPAVNFVVIGHIDAGKSTLVGQLLILAGEVAPRAFGKFQQQATREGKASFAYAWVMDEGKDERARGITLEVSARHMTTSKRRVTFLDAPGHAELVPGMLQGAAQADAAILVLDCVQFAKELGEGGQACEHLKLVRSLGVSRLIVAVNKLDLRGYAEDAFKEVCAAISPLLEQLEFVDENVQMVPVSAFCGTNVLLQPFGLLDWWTRGTLVEAIDRVEALEDVEASLPLVATVCDAWKTGSSSAVAVKVESGSLEVGKPVLIQPLSKLAAVKTMFSRGHLLRRATAGTFVDAATIGTDITSIGVGSVLTATSGASPVETTTRVLARVKVVGAARPLLKGMQIMCFVHTAATAATIMRLRPLDSSPGGPKRLRAMSEGDVGIADLKFDFPVCVCIEGKGPSALGRIILRDRGCSVAAGAITAIPATARK
eukprot:Polyplicarium_translucidae@DN1373_c0_g1_i2.p1